MADEIDKSNRQLKSYRAGIMIKLTEVIQIKVNSTSTGKTVCGWQTLILVLLIKSNLQIVFRKLSNIYDGAFCKTVNNL